MTLCWLPYNVVKCKQIPIKYIYLIFLFSLDPKMDSLQGLLHEPLETCQTISPNPQTFDCEWNAIKRILYQYTCAL